MMERNLLYNEIENILTDSSPASFQRELPNTALTNIGTIHYVDLEAEKLKFPNSGIFIPDYFKVPENTVDVILYFHGLIIPACSGDAKAYEKLGMKSYLENNKYFERLCPKIAESGKNVIFIGVTWLTKYTKGKPYYEGRGKYRNSITVNDFNSLMNNCLTEIQRLVEIKESSKIEIRNIILAGHSAGGAPVQRIIGGLDSKADQHYLLKVKECWGFDSQYSSSKREWINWLEKHSDRIYKHISMGTPSPKGFDVSKFKEKYPKRGVSPYMNISNLWHSFTKNKNLNKVSYYFTHGKTSHCGIVNEFFKECVETSRLLT